MAQVLVGGEPCAQALVPPSLWPGLQMAGTGLLLLPVFSPWPHHPFIHLCQFVPESLGEKGLRGLMCLVPGPWGQVVS